MKLSEIKLLIELWINSIFLGKVIWINGNSPIPARPFIALSLSVPRPLSRPYHSGANPSGEVTRTKTMQFSVTVNCYGENANQILMNIRDSLEMISVQRLLREKKISYLKDLIEVKDTTERSGSRFEERAVYEPAFIYESSQTEEVGFIENVNIEGVIHGKRGSDS